MPLRALQCRRDPTHPALAGGGALAVQAGGGGPAVAGGGPHARREGLGEAAGWDADEARSRLGAVGLTRWLVLPQRSLPALNLKLGGGLSLRLRDNLQYQTDSDRFSCLPSRSCL